MLKALHPGVNLLFGFTVYYPFVFFKQKLNKLFQRLQIFSRGSFLWVFLFFFGFNKLNLQVTFLTKFIILALDVESKMFSPEVYVP